METIVVATGNPGKLGEIREVLGDLSVSVLGLKDLTPIEEPEETGRTFAENARDKALYYAEKTNLPCLADDSGLEVDALNGAPGVHSARFAAGEVAPDAPRPAIDAANNAKLLNALADVPEEKRTARFVCHLALAADGEILLEARDTIEGRIARSPAGDNGFGYDPLFVVPEKGCTTAQLPPEQKNAISHRGKAVRTFAAKLQEYLAKQ
ncbi:MAG: RdgB/HAM1 family non-canonical purine NTP pyrophosphatase [Planctomycetota bacterium]